MASAVAADLVFCGLSRNADRTNLWFSCITGWMMALLMPASAPYWLPIVGALFAVIVVKMPFGSIENVPFVPVAVGYTFLSVCFKELVYSYPLTSYTPPLFGVTENESAITIAGLLKTSSVSYYDAFDILSGAVVGPVGTTCFAILLAAIVYILIRHPKIFVTCISFVAMCGILAAFFPRVNDTWMRSILLELSSGSLMFFVVFGISFPFLIPKTFAGQVAYGLFAGLLCMIMRYVGGYEDGACFAIIIMNAMSKLDFVIKNIKTNNETKKNVLTHDTDMNRPSMESTQDSGQFVDSAE